MMKSMRNAAKPIYLVVILAFVGTIIFAWGMEFTHRRDRHPGVIGKINDDEVSVDQYYRIYESKYQELLKTNSDPSEADLEKVRNEAWQFLVSQTLLQQQIEKNKIVLTDAELAEYVKYVPPQEFYQVEELQTNGQFDFSKYQNYIQSLAGSQDPRAEQMLMIIEQSVRSQIMVSKLQELVVSTAIVSPAEVEQDFRERNEKMQVNFVFLSGNNIDTTDITVSESEIKARYEQVKEKEFKTEPTATLKYIMLNKAASEADDSMVKAEIDDLYNRAMAGEDFATLAMENSQDPGSGKNGGDLGWFGRGRMVKPFEEAAFALKNIGDISAPVKSQFGWHIIKLTGRKTEKNAKGDSEEQIQASHILLKVEPSPATITKLQDQAHELKQLAEAKNIDEAAKSANLSVMETKPFGKGQYVPGIGQEPQFVEFAFSAKPGAISDIKETKQAFIIATPGTRKPAGYRSFDEVKDQLEKTIKVEKMVDRAFAKAERLYGELVSGSATLRTISERENLPIKETRPFARHEFVDFVGSEPAFIAAAFHLSESNRYSKPVRVKTGVYLLEFVNFFPADMSRYSAMSDSLYKEAVNKKRNDLWQTWFRNLTSSAKIEDYRSDAGT